MAEGVEEKQGEDAVRRDEAAVGAENAEPIRVAVHRDGEVESSLPDPRGNGREVGGDRLRMAPSESGIAVRAKALDPRGPGSEDRREAVGGGAVHRVANDPKPGRADLAFVHQAA